ncbi:MAG: uridylate kinase [Methylococcales bacterium]|nr:uridylate kinase [Methylococcales bacterium]
MMRVVKLGGSLLAADALPACLDAVQRLDGLNILTPGGGAFADQVRTLQRQYGFDDVAAHRMALLAMQQMAVLFNSLKPGFALLDTVAKLKTVTGTAIWLPQAAELDAAGVAASWDVTSDSLAAWLAGQLAADELILVKSAAIARPHTLADLQRQGVVDAAFRHFADGLDSRIRVVGKTEFVQANCPA